jgi:hypothetical protein
MLVAVMATWLYNLAGKPVAFLRQERVFTAQGIFLGRLVGSEVWHGDYRGSVTGPDGRPADPAALRAPPSATAPRFRLLRKVPAPAARKAVQGDPARPGIPCAPGPIPALGGLAGYADVLLPAPAPAG